MSNGRRDQRYSSSGRPRQMNGSGGQPRTNQGNSSSSRSSDQGPPRQYTGAPRPPALGTDQYYGNPQGQQNRSQRSAPITGGPPLGPSRETQQTCANGRTNGSLPNVPSTRDPSSGGSANRQSSNEQPTKLNVDSLSHLPRYDPMDNYRSETQRPGLEPWKLTQTFQYEQIGQGRGSQAPWERGNR